MIFNTPFTPHKGIMRSKETDKKIPYDLQKRYRSGVGSLIYLFKHSQTELSKAVCELSKCMDKANMSHYKDLLGYIKYVIGTK